MDSYKTPTVQTTLIQYAGYTSPNNTTDSPKKKQAVFSTEAHYLNSTKY